MFVDISCTKLYAKGKNHVEKADKITFLSEVKYGFHCADFHEIGTCSMALLGNLLYRIFNQIGKKV